MHDAEFILKCIL